MKWLIIIILIVLILGLYFFTPETKVLVGMAVKQLAPLKDAVINLISP